MAVALDRPEVLAALRGQVVDPSSPDYDLARSVFNGMIDRRPALIVRPLDTGDVVRTIELARSEGLPLAVRGGGHNVAGHSVCDDGIVLDLRLLREVVVDPAARVAVVGGGATWNDVDPATQRHGLAVPGGTFGTTGVAGLTLGGGVGHLLGPHGLTLDNLLRVEVVTAAGDVLVASEAEHPDLFWALRGGGGNFGVVTRFEFRLHELTDLVGGLLAFEFERAGEVLRRVREAIDGSPDELTTFALLGRHAASGMRIAGVSVCWTGTSDDARSRLELLRTIPGLLVDGVRPMSYVQLQRLFGDIPFGLRNYWKGHFVSALPDELIDAVVERYAARRGSRGTVLLEPMQGVACRVPDDATAFANRQAAYNVTGVGIWDAAEDDEENVAWSRAFADDVAPFSARGGGYLNYMSRDEPLERVEAAYGAEKFARLREIKRRYDPDNVFRLNHNIPPA